MTTSTLTLPVSGEQDLASWAAVAFVASYSSPGTRQAYTTQLRLWFDWCEQHHLEPLTDVRRPYVELYARDLETRGLAAATVALKLVVLTGFYRYCVEEQLLGLADRREDEKRHFADASGNAEHGERGHTRATRQSLRHMSARRTA